MAKGQNAKKEVKKKSTKTVKEKREEKKLKKASKGWDLTFVASLFEANDIQQNCIVIILFFICLL